MAPRKILFIDSDAASRKFVAGVLGQHGYQVELAATGKDGLLAAFREQPDLILIDPTIPDIAGEELAARFRADARTRKLPLVALSSDGETVRLTTCIEAGFSDFLVKSPTVVPALLESLAQLLPGGTPEATPGGLLITFLSAKGGTGTSTLCANIAMNMADSRPGARVVVADLVLPIGSIAGLVGYTGDMNISSLTQMPPSETAVEFLRGQLPRLEAWGFHLLAGCPNPECGNDLNIGRIESLVTALQHAYDFVVLDLGRSLSRISLPLIERADLLVMIMGGDPNAVGLYKAVWDYLLGKGVRPASLYVILNRAGGQEGLKKDDAEKAIGLPFGAVVPHQADNFSLADNHHQPYCNRFPAETTSIILKQSALKIMDLAARARSA